MDDNNTRQTFNPLTQIAFLLLLAGGGIVFGTIITLVIAAASLHVPMLNIADELLKPENVQISRWLQFTATFFYMAVPAIIFSFIISKKTFAALSFGKKVSGSQLMWVAAIVFTALLISGALGELNSMIPLPGAWAEKFKAMEDEYNKQVLALSSMKTFTDYIISLVLIALLPAMFEEMFFRGAMQQVLIKLFGSALAGILITSIIFSAIHLSFYGFLPRLFLGMMLGYIFYYSKNLWLNILAHFLNNAAALTQMYLLSKEGKLNEETMNDTFPIYYGLIAAAAFVLAFKMFRKKSEQLAIGYQ